MENIFLCVFLLTGILLGLAISPLVSEMKLGKAKVFYSVRTYDEDLGDFRTLEDAEQYLESIGFMNYEGTWFFATEDLYKTAEIIRYEGRERG